MIDDDAADKKTIEMNFIRFPSDLGGQVTPAYSTDADEKISRYILLQVAKFAVDHFQPSLSLTRLTRRELSSWRKEYFTISLCQ